MLTDGMNNVDVAQFPSVLATVQAANVLIFAIGVGPFVNAQEINGIATVVPGVTTSFPAVPNFSSLQGIVNNLVIATCVNIPGTPCGPTCLGFCSCAGVCVCPSSCDDMNVCTDDSCNPALGFQCVHTPHVCTDNNLCTQDLCNGPTQGCYFPPLSCIAPDICHTNSCNPALGCQFPPLNCNLNSPCYNDSCSTSTGCVHTPVNCNKCIFPVNVTCPHINCENNVCNPATGMCAQTPINCDDGNACTIDGCDVATGLCTHVLKTCNDNNACTHDFCNIQTGCYFVNFTVADCSSGSNCTIDSCNPATGCVHTPVVCQDNNNCTSKNCSFISGCFFPPLNCGAIPRISKFIGTCYQALCSNSMGGCYLNQLPGTTVDSCGVCNGKNECVIVPLPSNVPYVIGGALLAVIIIGSIVFGVALAAFGGKKGYDIWLKRRNNMSGASTNPLYNDNGLSGTNPMYSSRVTRM